MSTDTVVVTKDKLLEALTSNRKDHRSIVELAWVKYQEEVTKELEKMLKRAKKGKRVPHTFLSRLPIPQDYTNSFDQAIEQLKWDVRAEIELSRVDFNRFIRGEWEWSGQFAASSARYL